MGSVRENIAILTKFGKELKAIFELAEQAKEVEQLLLQKPGVEKELNAAHQHLQSAKIGAEEAAKDHAEAKKEASKVRANALTFATETRAKAEKAAEELVTAAKAEAADLVKKAKESAAVWDKRVQAAQKEFEAKEVELIKLEAKIEKAKEAAAALLKDVS